MPKRTALVTQHLENISREGLERYQSILYAYIKNRQGIYALFRRGKLYYVGLASNLRGRLRAHLRDKHAESWDRFSVYLTIGDDHMKELESLLLRIVRPTGNKVTGKFAKSESLLPRLKRDLRRLHDEETKRLFVGKAKRTPATRRAAAAKPKKSKVTGKRPILARYIAGPMEIRGRYKGKLKRARVRKDGSISFNKAVYNSPSLAGAAAVERPTCNGWTFWTYERSPGDWVSLGELRKR